MRCPNCRVEIEPAELCPHCGTAPPEPVLAAEKNTSGGRADALVPPQVREMGFCWGALMFPIFWRVAMNYPRHGFFGGPEWWILGRDGHAIAWQHRRFANLDQFRQTMDAWNRVGKLVALVWASGFAVALIQNLLEAGRRLPSAR